LAAAAREVGTVTELLDSREGCTTFRIVGWASVMLGIAALGLYVGRELRLRYKFNQRTPYDYFSHAGDSVPTAEYGVGI
jgi:hypothetical protein